jgi:hypothetical protein
MRIFVNKEEWFDVAIFQNVVGCERKPERI